MRNKGKVHPSPCSSSSSSSSSSDEALSVLNLLPAAILTLTCVLSPEDRQVLAYMITRSMKATTNPPTKRAVSHKPPLFHCDCFDCYTSFWFRWDSSPNRELIHQAIEAFEEHLNSGDHPKKTRHRKKEKMDRRAMESPTPATPMIEENKEPPALEPGKCEEDDDDVAAAPPPSAGRVAAANNHKGFARKVLPDVLGVFNSRLWSLWSPNL